MNKRGFSNRVGYIIIVVLVLAIVGWNGIWIWEENQPEQMRCLDAFHIIRVDENKTCVDGGGDILIYVEVNDAVARGVSLKKLAGIQLYEEPISLGYQNSTMPGGELVEKFEMNELFFLDVADYDFSAPTGERVFRVKGNYSNLTYLTGAINLKFDFKGTQMVDKCDILFEIEEVKRCDG